MRLTLGDVGAYLQGWRKPAATILRLLKRPAVLITFAQEHANRPRRFLKVVADYRRGMLVKDIEAKYACSDSTVLRYARLAGLKPRDRGFDPELRGKVIRLYKAGAPIAEIATKLGVSPAYISKTATEEGINRKKDKRRVR